MFENNEMLIGKVKCNVINLLSNLFLGYYEFFFYIVKVVYYCCVIVILEIVF